MKIPPLLIGAMLIFWGIETDNLLVSLVLCLVFEGSNIIKTRYHLKEDDFVKISDLTSLIFLGSIALILLNYPPIGFLRITSGWLPLILSPLMLAQIYSTGDTIIIGTRLGKKQKTYTHKPIDFRFYYIMFCLFGAATSNSRSLYFFAVMGLLMAWFLYWNRGRSYSPIVFVAFIVASFGLGYGCVVGVEQGHRYVLQKTSSFWHNYYRGLHSDPYKSHVNFGDTGRMKLSGEIIMRVESSSSPPGLIKEASFSGYRMGNWFGVQSEYQFLQSVTDSSWNLIDPPHRVGEKVTVEFNLPKEKGLLPVPHGGYRVSSTTIFGLEQNRDGTVKVVDGAPIITYELSYHPEMQGQDLPRAINVDVPGNEEYALKKVAAELKLSGASAAEKIAAVRKHFTDGFTYSLSLLGKGDYETAVGNFLLKKKSGFCEYYATATTLLLRTLGVPSRYAIGYAIMERSALEGKYVVRKRHSHAWAEAFVDGRWQVVDTTPPDWPAMDAERASFWEKIRDVFSFARHKYKLFQIGSGEDYTLFFSVIVVLLTVFLVFRIYRRLKIEQARKTEGFGESRSFVPVDSPFTQIIKVLTQSDVPRKMDESFVSWASRAVNWKDFDNAEFDRLYRLHLQLRFDPEGLGNEETVILLQGAGKYTEYQAGEKKLTQCS